MGRPDGISAPIGADESLTGEGSYSREEIGQAKWFQGREEATLVRKRAPRSVGSWQMAAFSGATPAEENGLQARPWLTPRTGDRVPVA